MLFGILHVLSSPYKEPFWLQNVSMVIFEERSMQVEHSNTPVSLNLTA